MDPATVENIQQWVKIGKQRNGCTHVVIVCDTFSFEDYPVYVGGREGIDDVMKMYDGQNMQKIMEIYSMSMDIDEQLKEYRAWHPNHL